MNALILCLLLGLIPAFIARGRGHKFLPWYFVGAVIWFLAFPASLFLKRKPDVDPAVRRQSKGGMWLAVVASVIGVIAIGANRPEGASYQTAYQPAEQPTATAASDVQPVADTAPTLPASEGKFIELIDRGAAMYAAGANEMAKGASRPRRARALCAAFPGRTASNWIGTVETLSSNSDGKGVLVIRLSPHATVGTTNNDVSDGLSDLKTLISPDSDLFQVASSLHTGQTVQFSGRFGSSEADCLQESSITQEGSMTDPEFLFQFEAIKPL